MGKNSTIRRTAVSETGDMNNSKIFAPKQNKRRLKVEGSGIYLISLFSTSSPFLFWCKEFWIITLIILVIVYILGKSKHLIATEKIKLENIYCLVVCGSILYCNYFPTISASVRQTIPILNFWEAKNNIGRIGTFYKCIVS